MMRAQALRRSLLAGSATLGASTALAVPADDDAPLLRLYELWKRNMAEHDRLADLADLAEGEAEEAWLVSIMRPIHTEHAELERAIAAHRATTMDGYRVKAAIAARYADPTLGAVERSLLRDLLGEGWA